MIWRTYTESASYLCTRAGRWCPEQHRSRCWAVARDLNHFHRILQVFFFTPQNGEVSDSMHSTIHYYSSSIRRKEKQHGLWMQILWQKYRTEQFTLKLWSTGSCNNDDEKLAQW